MSATDPFRLGLTGSIGMGKSTTARMFASRGIPVYDADATVHRLYSGEAAILIEQAFPGTTGPKGVDRSKLSAEVVGKPDAMKQLEAIIHPLAHLEERKFLEAAQLEGHEIVLLDIPLLFETGGVDRVDAIIVVTAPAEEQRRRVLARPDMNEEKFKAILAKQTPDAHKRQHCDYVIDTGRGMEHAKARVDEIIQEVREKLKQGIGLNRS